MVDSIREIRRGDQLIWDDGTGTLHQIEIRPFRFEKDDVVLEGQASPDNPALIVHTTKGFEVVGMEEVEKAEA